MIKNIKKRILFFKMVFHLLDSLIELDIFISFNFFFCFNFIVLNKNIKISNLIDSKKLKNSIDNQKYIIKFQGSIIIKITSKDSSFK